MCLFVLVQAVSIILLAHIMDNMAAISFDTIRTLKVLGLLREQRALTMS